ncbi:signal recognition particle 9 kDa protein isoform X1 [Suricata suricatta]|uniref:signal recognition particle 9 kDa protein isoform X1 n=1 Tax=Suricata suricatta TaxID=37032 RepID=UPI001155FB29|nr:signal recognition particle 9 kDa protein isoform X1 [Suricata suricatta]
MPQYQTWEEFSRAAEKLYLADPMKARVVLKYRHSDGSLCIKVTDDLVEGFLGTAVTLPQTNFQHLVCDVLGPTPLMLRQARSKIPPELGKRPPPKSQIGSWEAFTYSRSKKHCSDFES